MKNELPKLSNVYPIEKSVFRKTSVNPGLYVRV